MHVVLPEGLHVGDTHRVRGAWSACAEIMHTWGVKQCTELCWADMMQGGAWLQSDNFRLGWTGQFDGSTGMLVTKQKTADFSDDDIGA